MKGASANPPVTEWLQATALFAIQETGARNLRPSPPLKGDLGGCTISTLSDKRVVHPPESPLKGGTWKRRLNGVL